MQILWFVEEAIKTDHFCSLMCDSVGSGSSTCSHSMQRSKASRWKMFQGVVSWLQIKKNVFSFFAADASKRTLAFYTCSKTVLTQLQSMDIRGMKIPLPRKKNKTTKKLLHAQRVNFLKVCTQGPFFPRHYSGGFKKQNKKTRCDKCVKVSPCSQQGQLEDDLRAAHFTVCLCCRLNFAEAICIHTSFHILSFQKK